MYDDVQISAVIPTYNRGYLIGRAIESALRQSKPPTEIIVIDDGSTDDTAARVALFGERVRYIRQENGGSAAARHHGITAANYPWVALLDSDDMWLDQHLERMAAAIQATGGAARFYFADTARSAKDDGRRLWEIADFRIGGDYQLTMDGTAWVLRGRQPMMLQSTVFNKAAYIESGGFWKPLRYRDDTHLYMKLGIGGPVCAVNGVGCQMTDDDGGNRLSANYEKAKRGCQMQILMNEELLARPLNLSPAYRDELRSRLATAHRCVARYAWRERRLGEMVSHIVKSALAQPRHIPKLIGKGIYRGVNPDMAAQLLMLSPALRSWLSSTWFSLLHTAIDQRLWPGQRDYVRFIVLGRSRTGSNFLLSALNDHKQVMTFSELFRNNVINWESHLGRMSSAALAAYTDDPIRLLETRVYRAWPARIKAVGFKLFYYHAQTENLHPVWEFLKDDPHLHVIHIKRRNILESHVSRKVAGVTDRWISNANNTRQSASAVELDFDECEKVFQETRSWEVEADALFAAQPKLDVMYEDLAKNFAREIERVEQFLGIETSSVQATTMKQSRQELSKKITNYHELKTRFAGTPWAEFFTD